MFDKLSHFFLRRRNWTLPYALFLLIFAIVPLLLIVLYAFTDADGAYQSDDTAMQTQHAFCP